MKNIKQALILLLLFVSQISSASNDEENPNEIVAALIEEIRNVNHKFELLIDDKYYQLDLIDTALREAVSTEQKVNLLVEKDRIKSDISELRADSSSEISKIRYLKGLQIIKILYEKVLSLDHHFASVRTLNEINKISNPNQYPEYEKLKDLISAKKDKKTGFDLTSVLGTNTIVSVVQTFTNMVSSTLTKDEKEKELASVECILDFTLRMQNDLNTIYFETAFLQTSNTKMKADIELLFRDYTKPIGYIATLESCRGNDDWETVSAKMDDYLSKLKTTSGTTQYTVNLDLDNNWGESSNGELYRVDSTNIPIFQPLKTDKLVNTATIFEAYLNTNSVVSSVNVADEVLNKLANKLDLRSKMKGQKFDVSYSDRYLKTPFACLLMLQFLNKLQTTLNFEIDNFTFYGQKFYNERSPLRLFHEFKNHESRDSYLKSFSYELDASTINTVPDSIPHYRYFEFSNYKIKIIIRPDAGVEHGWRLYDSNLKVEEVNALDTQFDIIKMNNHPILYTISIENILQ